MTATHHFELDGLWASADVLGLERQFRFRDRDCTLRFPAHPMDFGLDKAGPESELAATGGYRQVGGVTTEVSVHLVQVAVEMPGDLTLEQVSASGNDAVFKEAHGLLRDAADIGREAIASVVRAVRAHHRQFWLAPDQVPPRVVWLSSLHDSAGRRLPIGYGDPILVNFDGGHGALGGAEIDGLIADLVAGIEPPLADVLLSDAEFHAWRAAYPNPHLGLMLAAISAEVKIKETLACLATSEQRPVLDLVLENPRDWSMAAASLFDKALKAVAGVSLRDEDRELYKAVDGLFVHRNRFAHRGDLTLDKDLIRKDLQAARRAFDWLDQKRAELLNRPTQYGSEAQNGAGDGAKWRESAADD